MNELTKGQVQQSAMLVVESMQMVIDQNNNDLAAAEKENERLEARIVDLLDKTKRLEQIAAALNEENVELKQRIARLESGRLQTVYPWKAE